MRWPDHQAVPIKKVAAAEFPVAGDRRCVSATGFGIGGSVCVRIFSFLQAVCRAGVWRPCFQSGHCDYGCRIPYILSLYLMENSMKNFRLGRVVVVVCALAGIASFGAIAEAQKTKGKTRAALTKQLMKGIVGANCGELKKALDADLPNWEDISLRAALLNEAGHFLMDDGRCPDGDWANAAKALQADSAAVLAAAEKMDAAAAKAAFGKLTAEACAVCHKAHKK